MEQFEDVPTLEDKTSDDNDRTSVAVDFDTPSSGCVKACASGRPSMEQCPYYDKCNSPLCPVDDELQSRTYVKGEAVCFYVREHVKGSSPKNGLEQRIFHAVDETLPVMERKGGAGFKNKLERARKCSSRRSSN